MHKHTKLVPQVHCLQCGRQMWHLTTTQAYLVYGCAGGHTRRIERTANQQTPAQRPPDNAA